MSRTKVFSTNLTRLRRERGLTIRDLAKVSGISARMIGHYEKHVSYPSLDKIETIAQALKISIAELLGIQFSPSTINENSDAEDLFRANIKTIKQLKKILHLNPIDRSTIYQMVDMMLKKEQSKSKAQ